MTRTIPSKRGRQAVRLPGAHRTRRQKPSGVIYVRVTAWRGRDAPVIGRYKGASDAEVAAAERADAAALSRRYAEAREGAPATETLADLLRQYEGSGSFTNCAPSTQRHRSRSIAKMKLDVDPKTGNRFVTLPLLTLKQKRAHAVFLRWRDTVARTNGIREADYRIETVRTAINWAVENGLAEGNPALGVKRMSNADRSDLVWEPHHNAMFFDWIRSEIARIWRELSPTDPRRAPQIIRLAAARDTVILAQSTGMRREDLSVHKWSDLQGNAIAYTALKGARRARTAGKKAKTTIVPILPAARAVYARRREATGSTNPWIITSARGGRYVPDALASRVYEITALLGVERTLHDCKGTFVTGMAKLGAFSLEEIGEMVDWSVDDVTAISRKYVNAPAIADAMLARIAKRGGG